MDLEDLYLREVKIITHPTTGQYQPLFQKCLRSNAHWTAENI
jgi:hypothetical protein